MQETSIGELNRGEEKIQGGKVGNSRTLVGKLWKLVSATNFKFVFFYYYFNFLLSELFYF